MARSGLGDVLVVNAERYDSWARMILAGGAPPPPWEQAPGYAYFLAALYAALGTNPWMAVAVQGFLSSLSCALLYVLARSLAGRQAGLATGLLAAAFGPFLYFQAELLPETLILFLCTAAMTTATALGPGRWPVTGALWALAYLVRHNILLAVPFAIAHAWMGGGRRAAVAMALPVLLTVGGLATLNRSASGEWVLAGTSGGVNLWLGNNPSADGVNPFFGPDQFEADKLVRRQAQTAVDADRMFRSMALDSIRADPVAVGTLALKKLVWTFHERELPNNADIEWRRSHSPVFVIPGIPPGFGVILVLAAAALACGVRLGRPEALLLAAPAVFAIGTCIVFFTCARFRLPLALPLLVLAGIGIGTGIRRVPQLRSQPKAALRVLIAAGGAAILAWGNWYSVREYRIAQIDVNTGANARAAGDFATAIRFLQLGLEREPRDAVGWIHLALALEQGGDQAGARAAYQSADVHVPGDPQVAQMKARFAARNGAIKAP